MVSVNFGEDMLELSRRSSAPGALALHSGAQPVFQAVESERLNVPVEFVQEEVVVLGLRERRQVAHAEDAQATLEAPRVALRLRGGRAPEHAAHELKRVRLLAGSRERARHRHRSRVVVERRVERLVRRHHTTPIEPVEKQSGARVAHERLHEAATHDDLRVALQQLQSGLFTESVCGLPLEPLSEDVVRNGVALDHIGAVQCAQEPHHLQVGLQRELVRVQVE